MSVRRGPAAGAFSLPGLAGRGYDAYRNVKAVSSALRIGRSFYSGYQSSAGGVLDRVTGGFQAAAIPAFNAALPIIAAGAKFAANKRGLPGWERVAIRGAGIGAKWLPAAQLGYDLLQGALADRANPLRGAGRAVVEHIDMFDTGRLRALYDQRFGAANQHPATPQAPRQPSPLPSEPRLDPPAPPARPPVRSRPPAHEYPNIGALSPAVRLATARHSTSSARPARAEPSASPGAPRKLRVAAHTRGGRPVKEYERSYRSV